MAPGKLTLVPKATPMQILSRSRGENPQLRDKICEWPGNEAKLTLLHPLNLLHQTYVYMCTHTHTHTHTPPSQASHL